MSSLCFTWTYKAPLIFFWIHILGKEKLSLAGPAKEITVSLSDDGAVIDDEDVFSSLPSNICLKFNDAQKVKIPENNNSNKAEIQKDQLRLSNKAGVLNLRKASEEVFV